MIQFGLKIATLGEPDASPTGATGALSHCYRLVSGRAPAFDTAGLYRSVLLNLGGELNADVDFQAGAASTGRLGANLRHTAELGGWMLRPRIRRAGRALSAPSGGSFSADFNPGVGAALLWGREVFRVTGVSGSGPYTLTVTGAQLGTAAESHGVEAEDDRELFYAAHGPFLEGVRAEVFSYDPRAADYSTETAVWAGVLESRDCPEPGVISVGLESLLGLIGDGNVFTDVFTARLEAENDGGWTYVTEPRRRPLATVQAAGDVGLFVVGGAVVYGLVYPSADGPCRVVFLRGPSASTPLVGTLPETPPEMIHEAYYVGPGSVEAAYPRDTNHLPYSDNAVTAALQILTSTRGQSNGDYDLGTAGLGLGIDEALIDVAAFERAALELAPLARLDGLLLNPNPEPRRAREVLADLLRPLGVVVGQGRGLNLAPLRFRADPDPVATVLNADVLKAQGVTYRPQGTRRVDRLELSYGPRGGLVEVVDAYNRARVPAAYLAVERFRAPGVADPARARALAEAWAATWHYVYPRVDFTLPERRFDIHLADTVRVTLTHTPNDAGTWPGAAVSGVVVQRRIDRDKGTMRLGVLLAGYQTARAGLWSLSAEVVSVAGANVTVEANAHTAPAGRYATDAAAWAAWGLPSAADVLDADLSYRGNTTVTGRSGNVLTVSGGTTPAAGDVLVLRDYDNASAAARALGAWLADGNDNLGSGNADAYEWGP